MSFCHGDRREKHNPCRLCKADVQITNIRVLQESSEAKGHMNEAEEDLERIVHKAGEREMAKSDRKKYFTAV